MEKQTPLFGRHVEYHGKMVPFAGWLLPVQYGSGIVSEHMAVRTKCGLFDVSHMGEILCTGTDAEENLNHLLTNCYTQMDDGQARYSPMCNERGGVLDDLIVYKQEENRYLIVVNAGNKNKDLDWMQAHRLGDTEFQDISEQVAQIAIQGPLSRQVLKKVISAQDIPERYYSARFRRKIGDMECMIAKTGYTGEDGYEIYVASGCAVPLWELLMEAGKDDGLIPCGLGARDTLRLEAGMPLYGHEMNEETTPMEAGLGSFVKMDKPEFVGKEAIKAAGPAKRKRVGLKVLGRGIIREHCLLYADGNPAGVSTSGTHCPYLGYPAAMAFVDVDISSPGQLLEAEVRGRRIQAEVVKLPFYKRKQSDK
ncbi:glycine cleavage system aminomethyltransferase GcvT [Lacrimispora sp. NSJ-141]|uniref:Aminomethyltransferase n=1 Tax=Lientehia hominis TaxID=2897778 RepID=A0AAP2RLN1_9FIRM|nr:glycine cleavage system aminomethyltransferase GcvT [Lientehia hominis]MCD2493418.1 glycine cleavage system aminomethyltransferase GcvT [Lientehia hominis]